jgi:hypothetical protein
MKMFGKNRLINTSGKANNTSTLSANKKPQNTFTTDTTAKKQQQN